MSIVDGLSDSTFTYPKTSLAGWLCSTTGQNCMMDSDNCPNNSPAQGWYFYPNVRSPSVKLYRVDSCGGPEDVSVGVVPDSGQTGFQAISADMMTNCKHH